MMVLDEPTNDLDVDTLELLEELLSDYEGTLLLVSHDRTFLDNVVTSTLVFEGDGKFSEYAGGYDDWERYQRQIPDASSVPKKRPGEQKPAAPTDPKKNGERRKLNYKEQRELTALPGKIEGLETEQMELHNRMSDSEFYRQPSERITATLERLDTIKQELEICYGRWQELESLTLGTNS
ncbi:MAG: hypothetical protein ACREQO_10420 [Candidatus Binatia bacterium]